MIGRLFLAAIPVAILAGGIAIAQGQRDEAGALVLAKRQADEATRRSVLLDREAAAATDSAARARAEANAIAARIQAAEADITAAEARIRIIEGQRAEQRARLAERQEPALRLTAALQTMARRPPALALVQPGSLDEIVQVRSLLASTMPVIEARTESLRAEIQASDTLRRQADLAVAALVKGREKLKAERIALARHEAQERRRSQSLADSAMFESDRALAFGEQARELSRLMQSRQYQAQVQERLAALPGPVLRPALPGEAPAAPSERAERYRLPVGGRLVTGMGEISDAGVHARGIVIAPPAGAPVVAPAAGRVAYAGPFRSYGNIVVIDHGGGWLSTVTGLAVAEVQVNDRIAMGRRIGRAGRDGEEIGVELRREGRPVAVSSLIG